MPRKKLTFRQRDLTAAIRAARALGVQVARYEVRSDGTIAIIPGEPGPAPAIDPETLAVDEAVKNAKI